MAYTKLDHTLTDSTIWQAPDTTRIVWITMLAMADQNGYIGASVPGLAGRARVSLQACIEAISTLEAPDEWSRTKDNEGRRIAPADGGWVLLNHAKYREALNADERRARSRVAMAALRAKRKVDEQTVSKSEPALPSKVNELAKLTQAEAYTEEEAKAEKINTNPKTTPTPSGRGGGVGSGKVHKFPPGFEAFWTAYPKKVSKDAACRAFAKLKPDAETVAAMVAAIAVQRGSEQWRKDAGQFIPHPATWLHDGRWLDELPGHDSNPNAWRNSRDAVINQGCRLGIGPFDEVAATVGSGPSWGAYRKAVIEGWTDNPQLRISG